MKTAIGRAVVLLTLLFCIHAAAADEILYQTEVSGWGNLRGIRVGDQLVPFTTAVGIYNSDFTQPTLSRREGLRTFGYTRDGNTVTVDENLSPGGGFGPPPTSRRGAATRQAGGFGRFGPPRGFRYTISYTDTGPGACDVHVHLNTLTAQKIGGVYYFLGLPIPAFDQATVDLLGSEHATPITLSTTDDHGRYLIASCNGIRISGVNHQTIEADFAQPTDIVIRNSQVRGNTDIQLYFPILVGNVKVDQQADLKFTLKAAGTVDSSPVTVTIDPTKPGRTFDGIGGNFRIQNATLDPIHIQYIMDHMRVAYGRVALPWNAWQPKEDAAPPLLSGIAPEPPADTRESSPMVSVDPALQISQQLAKQNIPMMISCWFPPTWAVLPNRGPNRGFGFQGRRRLDPAKWDDICKSLGSYLLYLRDHCGAEPRVFSFNESNAGINVLQTAQDHDIAIKKLGAYFASIGLKTKMALGDTSEAPPVDFIQPALNDPEAVKYIGAVSFHSWRGATDAIYQKWSDAATKLGVPLIDAEGGNDAQASGYSEVLREPWYSLDEAAEYVRIMRICQPETILEWQLTENYSVLSTDAAGNLSPTQRFFNLKQFNQTPAGSAWLPVESTSPLVLPAAAIEQSTGICTIHLVNNGAARDVTIKGLPSNVAKLDVYVTDKNFGMTKVDPIDVSDGSAKFTLPGQALTTLVGRRN